MLETLRVAVAELNRELPRNGLVAWTSGNVSGRDFETGYVVIKPSGVRYEELTADEMVVVDLEGNTIFGRNVPSTDCASHLYIYRARREIGGIVHTHSPFATAFAVAGKGIPPIMTSMADEFGGGIPCGGYATIGGEAIGAEVVKTLAATRSRAVLLRQHGVFTVGKNAVQAVKTAVMAEDAARIAYYAMQLGGTEPLSQKEIDIAYDRYTNNYGQKRRA